MSVYKRNHTVGKSFKNSVCNVEVYGYIPRSVQIKNMLTAGKNLDAYRTGLYMYNAGSFDNFSGDPALLSALSPVYNDKLSALEKSAFLTGLKKGYNDFVSSCTDEGKLANAKTFYDSVFGRITLNDSASTGENS